MQGVERGESCCHHLRQGKDKLNNNDNRDVIRRRAIVLMT